jgi:hypothetical protein
MQQVVLHSSSQYVTVISMFSAFLFTLLTYSFHLTSLLYSKRLQTVSHDLSPEIKPLKFAVLKKLFGTLWSTNTLHVYFIL